jgi:hypothetical protein
MSKDKVEAARAEVQRLLDVGFIREVTYPQWLESVMMVRKKNGKCRMCTNFTNLNKCFPKDEMMTLLDCFSRYHRIWLHRDDKEKTCFITPFGTYYKFWMSEGLHNDGPTFCRMMKAALKDQVGRNVLSYVDDEKPSG